MSAVYDGLLSEVYDAYTDADGRDDLPVWKRLARECGGTALELGCGTGRILIPLLEAGLRVEGLDNSEDMIALCHARAAARNLAPVLHRDGMSDYSLARSFSLVFSAAGTFTLLAAPGEMERALLVAAAHMRSGGMLALSMDVPRPQSHDVVVARDLTRAEDGARLRCLLEPLEPPADEVEAWRMINEVISPDGRIRRDSRSIAFRRPDPTRFAAMVGAAGFEDVELRDATGIHPMEYGEEEYLVLANRS